MIQRELVIGHKTVSSIISTFNSRELFRDAYYIFCISDSILVPQEAILTPLVNSCPTSYSISFDFLYFNISSYLLLVNGVSHMPESLNFSFTNVSSIYNITIALNYCPSNIKSTFLLSTSGYVIFNDSLQIM